MTPVRAENQPVGRPLLGVALALIAVFFFAVSDALTKYLTERHPIPIVLAVRYLVSLILLLVIAWPRHRSALWRVKNPMLVVARGVVITLASLTMGLALRLMPVGETIAILYLSPFAIMALAIPIFGERVSPFGWGFVVVACVGAMLILRPGGALDPLGVIFALLNATCATVFHLMTRHLSRSETAMSLLFFVTLVGAVVFSAAAVPHLSSAMLSGWDLAAAAFLGAIATGGHYVFSLSYREAPASLVAPVNYFHLVWAALLGVIVFGHWPDVVTLAGMAMIFAAGVGVASLAQFAAIRRTKI
jgi:drug/metabolite transporter (DMT)-like permease